MSQKTNPDPLKQFLSSFSQIGALVAAVTLVIQLVIGDVPGLAYGQTFSALSLAALALMLWLWRWPKITEERRRRGSKTFLGKERSFLDGILRPFRASEEKKFVLTTARRRLEGAFLALTSVLVVFLVVPKFDRIGEELSGIQCRYAESSNVPLIVIATFNEHADSASAFKDRLFTKMVEEFDGQMSVCKSREVVADPTSAMELGDRLKKNQSTTLVVWGDSDARSVVIRIAPLEWEAFALEVKADTSDAGEIEGWAQTYIPQIVEGWTQFIAGNNPAAIRTLDSVTRDLKAEPWSGNNREAFARLYFQLAQLYEAEGRPQQAIEAYSGVLENDADFDVARLNRGLLYMDIDPDKAMADFTFLIEHASRQAGYAYLNRAFLQSEWELQKSDLSRAIELEPDDPDYLQILGMNALYAKDFETAEKAFADVRGLLNDENRDIYVEELQTAAAEDDSLRDVVERIVLHLNEPIP